MLPEMRMIIDVKSREEDESTANGPQWAEGAGSSLLGPFLRFLPRKLRTTVQASKLHDDTQLQGQFNSVTIY